MYAVELRRGENFTGFVGLNVPSPSASSNRITKRQDHKDVYYAPVSSTPDNADEWAVRWTADGRGLTYPFEQGTATNCGFSPSLVGCHVSHSFP
jgi:hypothetical protein